MKLPETPEGLLAVRIVRALRANAHQAYLVGGCVRDLVLGVEPKDYDVATDARPESVLRLFPRAGLVGAQFGVVLVREDGAQVEVATFRSDHAYFDGRHPESVRFETDPRQDVLRRDFTVNSLLADPETGEILDYAGGRRDIERRLIRAVGDPAARFGEDHLRMLRAVRFAARLDYDIEPATMAAIQALRRSAAHLPGERIRDEILRILTEGRARRGFELLDESGLLEVLLPEVAAMEGVEQPPEFHPEGDVWTHTLLMLEMLRDPSPELGLGVLLHDVGKPPTFRVADRIRFDHHARVGAEMAAGILRRLRCANDQIRHVEALVANHLRLGDAPGMRESTLKRLLRLERFEEHLELHRLDCLASFGGLETYHFLRGKLESTPPEAITPPPLVTGRDLIREGYVPGPAFRGILGAVETAQLEGRIQTHQDALRLVRALYPLPDGLPKPDDK